MTLTAMIYLPVVEVYSLDRNPDFLFSSCGFFEPEDGYL